MGGGREGILPILLSKKINRVCVSQFPPQFPPGTNTIPKAMKAELTQNLCIECNVSQHKKCERCWNYRDSVGSNTEHPTICARCVTAL